MIAFHEIAERWLGEVPLSPGERLRSLEQLLTITYNQGEASGSVASVKWMRDLLDLIEVRGLSVSSIVVGDFRLQLASPWPARKPPAPPPPLSEQAEQVKSDVENAKSPALAKLSPERLARARKECKAVLGRVLSDDAIAEMVEAGQL